MLAGMPLAPTPRGGVDSAFDGTDEGSPTSPATPPAGGGQDFTGMGPFLELPDKSVFKSVDALVRRQELPAQQQLQIDTHWLYVILGYPFSTLTKDPGKDTYRQFLPYGSQAISIQAVPNKSWDLVRKATSTILGDFPEVECQPLDDSEEAANAADLATRVLQQDAGGQGTNDGVLWVDRVERSLSTGSSFLECWSDRTGGGYVPLQVEAHPAATDVEHAELGPDGMPTTDLILRYATADGQFTDDPMQAALQWQPKLRASKWNNEHIKIYPETATVDDAEKVIILGYCTLSEAKRRWAYVAGLGQDDLSSLCDWEPPRYISLLPPRLRARWKLSDGPDKEKGGTSDERIMFYYHVYIKASPDYPRGADVVVTGALDSVIIDKNALAAEVTINTADGDKKELRCMEIPVVQICPLGDPYEQNPRGRAFIELFAGAAENNAALTLMFSDVMQQILRTPFSVSSTSPISGRDVERARATGDFLIMKTPADKPNQLQPPVLPTNFVDMYNLTDEAINSIAAQERAASGADNSKERSGKALQIAIGQNNVGNTSPQTAVMNAYARWSRIKVERIVQSFSNVQQLAYEGEDGSYKQEDFSSVDFALIGKTTIKAGTGTMTTPDGKVQYLANLKNGGMIEDGEMQDAARPIFSKRLGLPPNSHEQYVERCLAAWRKGPPNPKNEGEADWASLWQTYSTAKQQHDQAMAQYQARQLAFQTYTSFAARVAGGPPPPALGPEGQNASAMQQYQLAVQWMESSQQVATQQYQLQMTQYQQTQLQAAQQAATQPPQPGQPPAPQPPPPQLAWPPQQPVPPQLPPLPPEPWHPFKDRPNDKEPIMAAIWQRKQSKEMSTARYTQFRDTTPAWNQPFDDKYNREITILQQTQAQTQHLPSQPRS